MAEISVRRTWGCLLVEKADSHSKHRWWFEQTKSGRLVFISQVAEYDKNEHPSLVEGRHYVSQEEAEVPENVRDALEDEGFERIFDSDGKEL